MLRRFHQAQPGRLAQRQLELRGAGGGVQMSMKDGELDPPQAAGQPKQAAVGVQLAILEPALHGPEIDAAEGGQLAEG
jgi:hypothetical protein